MHDGDALGCEVELLATGAETGPAFYDCDVVVGVGALQKES